MKILLICTVPFSKTGIPCHIRNYYNELNKYDCAIDICSSHFDREFVRTLTDCGEGHLRELKRGDLLGYIKKLRALIKNNKYDIVHIHGNSSTMSLELFACFNLRHTITVVHAHNTSCSHPFINSFFKPFLLSLSNHKCACSSKAGDWLYGTNTPYTVINNGITSGDYLFSNDARKSMRNRLGVDDDCLLIGHIGEFNEQKNQKFLIDVAGSLDSKNQRYKMVLIGDGWLKDEVITYAKSCGVGDNIIVLPAQNDVTGFYSAFDLFAFPSNWEGLGMVLIEAQYSGLTCLASDRVPLETRVTDNISYLPLKTEEWTGAIGRFKPASNEIRETTKISDIYDIEKCASDLFRLYDSWIKAR
ncbi:MAG: glycosyltransferase [Erysipelotrichaceae bacterium]|nr:glycosyltransferase [Erysipelotrichaceae bacterium]